jgi:hypothetical protein
MIVIGFLGISLGALPDILPDFVPYILLGDSNTMQVGYKKLVNYINSPKYDPTNGIALKVTDKEYNSIYELLYAFDPTVMPPLNDTLIAFRENGTGNISIDRGGLDMEPATSSAALFFNRIISFQDKDNRWLHICEMRDLNYLMRDAIIRYCSKIGFSFAFIALLIEGISSIKGVLKNNEKA